MDETDAIAATFSVYLFNLPTDTLAKLLHIYITKLLHI